MNTFKHNIMRGTLLLAAACAFSASAQDTYSGYFLDNYNYRYQMNPAFGNESSFAGFPAAGNINVNMQGNLHLTEVLYNLDGKTVLFTNPGISTKEALDGIGDSNKVGLGVNLNLLNVGFKALGGYNTVSVSARANANVALPGSLFRLLKQGIENKTYDISDLRASAYAYGQIALNHSRDISQVPGLRVGAAIKFILPVANIDANFQNASLRLGEDSWDIQSQASISASMKGLSYKTDYNETTGRDYVSGVDIKSAGISGFGMGLDLGAVYDWNDFQFSLAFNDIGFVAYSDTQLATTNGVRSFSTSRYEFEVNGDDDTFDNMKDDLSSLYQLDNEGNIGNRSTSLNTTMNIGVRYTLPYYRRLTFGLLNSTHFAGPFTTTQFRISANARPIDILSASVSLEAGTYGVGFGWLVDLCLKKGFSIFIGMDHTPGRLCKQFIPLNSNMAVNFGINFPF